MYGIAIMFTSVSGKRFRKRWTAVLGVFLMVGFLQTPWGITLVARLALHASDVELQFDSIHGFWMHSVEVRGIEGKIATHFIRADTVRAQPSLWNLLTGTLHFRQVDLVNPEFHLHPTEVLESSDVEETQISLPAIDMLRIQGGTFIDEAQHLDVGIISVQGVMSNNEVHISTITADVLWQDERFTLESDVHYQPNGHSFAVDSLVLAGTESTVLVHGHAGPTTNLYLTGDPFSSDLMGVLGLTTEDHFDVTMRLSGLRDSLHIAVDASSEGGQQLMLRAAATIGYPSLHVDTLEFEKVDLSQVSSLPPATLTGSITGHVSGIRWDSLDGTVMAEFNESLIAGISIPFVSISAHLDQDQIHADVQSDLELGSVHLTGNSTSLFQSGEIQGQFREVDTEVVFAEHTSMLNGDFRIGWGDSLVASIQVLPGYLGQMNLESGAVQLYRDDQGFQMTAGMSSDSSLIEFRAVQDGSGLVSYLQMDSLDIGKLMNQNHLSSRISLVAESKTNWPPDSVVMSVEIHPSMWDQISIEGGTIQATLQGFDLHVDGNMDLASGTVAMKGNVNFESTSPQWKVVDGQIDHLNIEDLGLAMATDLNANFQFHGSGFTDVEGQILVNPSSIHDEVIHEGFFSFKMANAVAEIDSRLSIGYGGLESQVMMSPLDQVLDIQVKHGVFQGLNIGSLLGDHSFSTSLSGRIDSLSWGEGGLASVTLDSSEVGAIGISGSHFTVKTMGDALSVAGVITKGEGSVEVKELFLGSEQKVRAVGSFHNVPIADIGIPGSRLNGSFDLDLQGFDPRTWTLCHAEINADRTRVGDVEFERIRVSTAMQDGVITLYEFDIHSNAGQISGDGSVSLFGESSDSVDFIGEITNASLLAPWTGDTPILGAETDTLWAQFSHQNDSLRWRAGVEIRPMEWKSTRLFHASGYAEGTLHDWEPRLGQAQIILDRLSVPNLSARQAQLGVKDQDGMLLYESHLHIDENRSLALNGEVDLTARTSILEKLDLYLGEEQWHLGVPAQILADEGIRIRYFVLESENQEITLDGIINPDGEQRLGFNAFNVELSPFTDLFGLSSLGGVVNADLFFQGPATSPTLTGSLDFLVDSDNQRVGSVSAQLDYTDLGLDIQSNFEHIDGSSLSISGLVPIDLRLKKEASPSFPNASMNLNADRFNLAWVSPFLAQEEISRVQGKLTGELSVSGSMTNPNMLGELDLSQGSMRLPQLGIAPTEFEIHAMMRQDTVYMEHVSVNSGQGSASGSGHVILGAPNQGQVMMAVEMSDFEVTDTAPYEAEVSGSIVIDGTVLQPSISGDLDMTSAVIRPEDVPVTLADGLINFTEEDLQMLEEYFNIRAGVWDTTTYSLIDALTMDISIGIPGTVRLHSLQSPEMTVFLSGSLNITKEPYADQQFQGTVSIVPDLSYLRQFGRRFDIQRGRVTFSGSATNPFFDLQARLEIPNRSGLESPVTILMDASGEIQDPETLTFELRSEPVQLDRSDMISYMATGRPAADAFQLGSGGALQTGSNLALQQLSSLVAGAAGAGLGLDVVQIDPETNGDITLTAGKYVSSKLFTSVRWPITASSSTSINAIERNRELVIEYSLYPWLLARMRGETGAIGLSFLYQYTW